MKLEIIAAILTQDPSKLQQRLRAVSGLVQWAQIDIMDGEFVDNISAPITDLRDLDELELNLSAHLMVANPLEYIASCKRVGCKRVEFHYEAAPDALSVIEQIKALDMEVGIALNPETPVEVLADFIQRIDTALLLGVHPGYGGQKFIPETLKKITELRALSLDITIAIDGGVNLQTIKPIAQAGANAVVVGSAIFDKNDIAQAIKNLTAQLNG